MRRSGRPLPRMPEVDPASITAADWSNVGDWLHWLWAYFFAIVILAFTFLTAHALIPSLIASGHLPREANMLRPPIYFGAIVIAGLATLFMVWTVDNSHLLEQVYNRFWI
jgi:hypothetical protein